MTLLLSVPAALKPCINCWCSLQSYPQFQDFIVIHDYLATPNQKQQARVRKRGQNGNSAACLCLTLR